MMSQTRILAKIYVVSRVVRKMRHDESQDQYDLDRWENEGGYALLPIHQNDR